MRPMNTKRVHPKLSPIAHVLGLSLGWLLASMPALAQDDRDAAVRAEFMQQIDALDAMPSPQAGSATGVASEALRQYVLYPYLEAQRLRAPLRFGLPADDAAIAALLLRDGDAPSARDLRRDWLRDLARRRSSALFLQHYSEPRADAGLRCERLNALFATQAAGTPDEPLRKAVLDVWMTGARLPDACVAAFDQARTRGWLTPTLNQQRARLALEAGNADLAEFLLRSVPADAAPTLRAWAALLRNPERELDALTAAGPAALTAQAPEALAAVISKLGRRDPAGTATRLDRLVAACGTPCPLASPATPGELRREVALGAAWSRLPITVAAFKQVDEAVVDERAHEWRVRAALWAGDWTLAQRWLAAMPPALAEQPRWRYWRARAEARQDAGNALSRSLYQALAAENGFYSVLAAHQLGQPYAPTPIAAPRDATLQQQLASRPGMQRARELWRAGRNAWSSLEWGEELKSLSRDELIQAARLAQTWGAQVQTVTAASKAQVFDDFELLYPRPFGRDVDAAARLSGVPSNWIYAVMRQESLYDPRARSRADALGLLQMLLGTARDTARRQQQPLPGADDLFDPSINTRLGALHLRELLQRYDQRFVLVLGAYNAGPKPVARWQPSAAALDADVWIENVPYNETRSYIQRVIWHSVVFGWRGDGQPQRAGALLKPITPAAVASGADAR